nr:hypothetical protein [Halobellus inordinatus]
MAEIIDGAEWGGTTHNPRLLLRVGVVPNTADGIGPDTNDTAWRNLVTVAIDFHNPTVESKIHFLLLFVGVWRRGLTGRKGHCIKTHLATAKRFGEFPVTVSRLRKLLLFNLFQFCRVE